MKTIVYIDGFNLYYSLAKPTKQRWLNLEALARATYPMNDIVLVRYFTAVVQNTPGDPDVVERQIAYIRALEARGVIIHYGKYEKQKRMVELPDGSFVSGTVRKEKATDVNLASWMLLDAFRGKFEAAIVMSNDSDYAMPIRMVKNDLDLNVVVASPADRVAHRSVDLKKAAKKIAMIPRHNLAACVLPDPVVAPDGTEYRRPPTW